MLRLELALWLFVASTVGQAVYIWGLAPLWFDREDPPDPTGRRQTTNAFVIYAAVTALVVWAAQRGLLFEWREISMPLLAFAGVAFAAHVLHVLKALSWPAGDDGGAPGFGASSENVSDEPLRPPHESKRVKVMADYGSHPLWALDEDTGGDLSPAAIGLSADLARDLVDWAERYGGGPNRIDEPGRPWTDADFSAHEAEARPLAMRLASERPDLVVYVVEPGVGVVEVRAED